MVRVGGLPAWTTGPEVLTVSAELFRLDLGPMSAGRSR